MAPMEGPGERERKEFAGPIHTFPYHLTHLGFTFSSGDCNSIADEIFTLHVKNPPPVNDKHHMIKRLRVESEPDTVDCRRRKKVRNAFTAESRIIFVLLRVEI